MVSRAGWIAVLFLLAACESDPSLGALFGPVGDRAVVARGAVTVAGPVGYCPDRSATSGLARGTFVVLGSCASVRNNPNAAAPAIPGILTASVSRPNGAEISGSFAQLERFFRSNTGKAALARNGNASSVQILTTRRMQGAFAMKIRDRSPGSLAGLSSEYWRALLDLRGRLITLSVIAFDTKPMSDTYARATLESFINRVRRENADPAGQ